jgi:hypothetical protein
MQPMILCVKKNNKIMSTQIINQLHAETKTLIQEIQSSSEDYFEILNGIENLYSTRDKVYKEKIENCTWQMYAPAQQMIEAALEEIYRKAIESSKNNADLIEPLRTFFLCPFNKWRARYDLIAALGDPKSAQLVFERVNEQLKKDVGDDIDRAAFMGLVDLAAIPAYREQVLQLIRNGFDSCIKSAGRKLVNDTIFNLLGQLCVALEDKQAAGELYKAFVFAAHEDQHYEMNTAASRLAIYLTALDYKGPVEDIKNYIDYFTESYDDDEFVVRARYAYWWFEKKSDEALDFLNDPEKKKSLGIVAALLADLNDKRALPILQKRIKELTNKVTIEIFQEAISRLERQKSIPENKDRIIWMFGFITESEIALGDETDNIFIKRANQSSEVDLGIVHEVDDSTKEDL